MDVDLTAYREQAGYTRFARLVPKSFFFNANFRRFMAKYIPAVQKGVKTRNSYKEEGVDISSFITASTNSNFSEYRAGDGVRVHPTNPADNMTTDQWQSVFEQSVQLGMHMIVLMCGSSASGEILNVAAQFPQLIFPTVIDNKLIDDEYIAFFDKNRNMIPVLSVSAESDEEEQAQLKGIEAKLQAAKMAYGAYVTVTSKNIKAVTDESFIADLKNRGYTNISYMEHILSADEKDDLLLSKSERKSFKATIEDLTVRLESELVIFYFVLDRSNLDRSEYIHVNPDGSMESYFDLKHMNLKSAPLLNVFEHISVKKKEVVSK